MSLALIAALPFLGALLPGIMIRAGRNTCALATGSVTALALIGLLLHAPAVLQGEVIQTQITWMPLLGLNANFFLDGLGLLFAGLILGIGLLIITYARFYLAKSDPMGQFYTYLLLFQGAMVGIVLSDNILLLLIFWELTSLSSFLLIGYWRHLPEGRQGARMALAVTGMGGLALIGGMLILGHIVGSYELTVILENRELIQQSDLYAPALLLILLGAFTKSAQFPFHFWLPHAMAAPTPVSAYLHSATMVKAGLFLMARLWPVLSGTDLWFWLVAGAGLITMVMGAVIALFKDDLKGLLAFSTVSHLGLITMLLGIGTDVAAVVAVFHIINHATFKAALFMTAGIIDHEAHTRDIKRLGGLRTLMPVTFVLATVASLSMAGIPPLNGFLSKEMMLEQAADVGFFFGLMVTIGAMFSVAYSLRYIVHVFLGPKRDDYPAKPHDPGFGMWVSPALLVVLVVLIGLFPNTIVGPLVATTGGAVIGSTDLPYYSLALWHGFNIALLMSVAAVALGYLVLRFHPLFEELWNDARRPEAKEIFDALIDLCARGADRVTNLLHDGAMTRYLAIFTASAVLFGFAAFMGGTHGSGTRETLPMSVVPIIGWLLIITATIVTLMVHRNRLLSLVMVAVIGLIISIGFAYLSAPDLALTQLSVEVVTVILLLLALHYLPKETPVESTPGRRIRDGAIAGFAGLGVTGLLYAIMTRDHDTISWFHLEQSYPGGGGTNVVNVILVDFRGFDTFGEIIVLGVAALGIYAIIDAALRGPASRRLANFKPDFRRAGDRHPMMMVVATRVILPVALTVGVFIFLRGHNEPGGGFIAGLVVSIALLMQYMASGFTWAQKRQRFDYHAIIAAGIIIAALTGVGSWFYDAPFLSSAFDYYTIPPLSEFELASAIAFDVGVFLTVVGSVMLALAELSRIGRHTSVSVNKDAMDIDPRADTPAAKVEGH
ncbi:monovalent cation/H+ antiporter subunit A [Rhodobacteraceae bacterium 2376]|uniref:Monovalent cation/H+ antiporter subunit A n=1 Tax=Rhabdonatronobacter sediminivivens TaxID=2743469 RepID=A0A7Z0HY86_9RHOB|nr:monovalent cation/H+ antiporter subunit A [Rhabdonatronobacter sediminivivens]NYS24480.1 monovalent cation/H+ antiporter subunit A [Rhabdonatronobacter sediminivivens]